MSDTPEKPYKTARVTVELQIEYLEGETDIDFLAEEIRNGHDLVAQHDDETFQPIFRIINCTIEEWGDA